MQLDFEPVTSHAYDLAREEYRQGVLELEKVNSGINPEEKSNFNCSKLHFSRCVSLLDRLYLSGQVESIAELPSSEKIKSLNRIKLESLSYSLGELYFPEMEY